MSANADDRAWTVQAALDWCVGYLASKGDEHPRRSAEWLLSAATGLSRVELYAYHDRPLSVDERESLRDLVRQRGEGAPLQYVTGEVAFRHIVVKVRPGVLIPRPETEILVGEAVKLLDGTAGAVVADACTGSGCVALSLAHECPDVTVHATDISETAVEVAAENTERLCLGDRVKVHRGDLLAPLPRALLGKLDLVVSNPPYVPTAELEQLPAEVAHFEPRLALDGGPDGLDPFRRLVREAADWLRPGGALAVELDERMVQTAAEEAVLCYEEVRVIKDLAGRDRIVVARRR